MQSVSEAACKVSAPAAESCLESLSRLVTRSTATEMHCRAAMLGSSKIALPHRATYPAGQWALVL